MPSKPSLGARAVVALAAMSGLIVQGAIPLRAAQPSAAPARSAAAAPQPEFFWRGDFTAEEFTARRARVLERIGPDAVAFLQGAPPVRGFAPFRQTNEFYYLCGVERPQAYLLIDGRTGRSTLFVPRRDPRTEAAEGREIGVEDAPMLRRLTGVDDVRGLDEITGALARAAVIYTPLQPAEGAHGSRDELRRADRAVAADPWDGAPTREEHLRRLIEQRCPGAEIRDLVPILNELRAIKSPAEIALLRRAGQLAALGVVEAMKSTRPGLYEYQLDAAARYIFFVNGAQGIGYRSITAAGPNIPNMHYYRNNTTLDDGEMVLMDFAPDVGYYTSDIGRMWPVNGKYPPPMRELYGFVIEYHKAVLSVLRPGATREQLRAEIQAKMRPVLERWTFSKPEYRAACEALVERGGGDFSHAVGMAVHDETTNRGPGARGPRAAGAQGETTATTATQRGPRRGGPSAPLAPGMVFSIDPAIRVPSENLYIRCEDTIVITEDGHENFTRFAPYDLDEVEALMREPGVIDLVPPVPPPATLRVRAR